jgi:hypothetical protein
MLMLVPFLAGGAAVVSALVGLKSGHDGLADAKEAERRRDAARAGLAQAEAAQERVRRQVNRRAERFGRAKLAVIRDTCDPMRTLLEALRRHGKRSRITHLDRIEIATGPLLGELRQVADVASTLFEGAAEGAVRGAVTGAAVYGLAGSVGVASTGAAISGLSGAAATSASLAWLGGGSLAAGGLGMAGGTAVLGGLVAAPVVLLGGLALAKHGSEALSEATRFGAEAQREVALTKARTALLARVPQRIDELEGVILALRARTHAAIHRLRGRVPTFDFDHPADQACLASALRHVRALIALLDAPVLAARGDALDAALPGLITRTRHLLA